jgi:xanthine/uracil permease
MPSIRALIQWVPSPGSGRKRPYDLVHSVDEQPPAGALWLLAAQHAITVLASLVFVLAIASMAGLDAGGAHALVAVSLISMALCTALQAWGGRLGASALAVHQPDAFLITVAPAVIMAQGPGAVAGIALAAALVALVIAPLLPRLRAVFPPAVAGTVILMGGVTLIEPTMRQALGLDDAQRIDPVSALIAGSALACMVALPVWGKGRLRLVGLLGGILIGVAVAGASGELAGLDRVLAAPWFALPHLHAPVFRLDAGVLLVVMLLAVVKQLDNVGCLITVDKMNNADWRRPDMTALSRGVRANGLGDLIGSLAGALPTGVSSSCIALSHATRSTSRSIGLATASLLLALVFLPKVTQLLTLVPEAVLGAVGIYAAAFLILSGIELIASRALDSRTIFAVGFSMLAGVGMLILPGTMAHLPEDLRGVVGNPLIVSSALVVGLNLLFRIGIRQTAGLSIQPEDPHLGRTITDFVERQGAQWGVRRELVTRAASAALEAAEAIGAAGRGQPRAIHGRFDEYRLDIEFVHDGAPLALGAMSTLPELDVEALLDDDEDSAARLEALLGRVSSTLIQRLADKVVTTAGQGGQSVLRLHFDH